MNALWVPLDVNFLWDSRVIGCGFEAQILFVRSLCLSKQTASNGFVSEMQAAQLCFDMDDRGHGAIKQLLEAELWLKDGEDYQIRSWLKHNKSAEELEKLKEIRSKAGAKGGKAKRKQVASPLTKQNQAEVEVEKRERREENSSSSLSSQAPPEIEKVRTNGKTKGTRVPDPFPVSDEMAEWAAANLPGFNWERESSKFLDYWRAKPGAAGVKLDWCATWRNWMRTACERSF